VAARTEGDVADQDLAGRIAEPLALLAAGAILPAVVHALQERVTADVPQASEQWIGAGKGTARLGGIVRAERADVTNRDAVRRVAHRELGVTHRRPLEALEALHTGSCDVATDLRSRRLALHDARLCERRAAELARHAFADGELDDLAAPRLELDERIAGMDAAEIEHHRRIELRRRAHRRGALIGVLERLWITHEIARRVDELLLIEAILHTVGRTRHDAVPAQDARGRQLRLGEERNLARHERR